VEGWCTKLLNEALRNLYISPDIIIALKLRRKRWAGHVRRMGKRNAYRILVGNPEKKRPLGRPRHRWVDKYCNGFHQRIARQQLGKHLPLVLHDNHGEPIVVANVTARC
jgi:hypothetical protein